MKARVLRSDSSCSSPFRSCCLSPDKRVVLTSTDRATFRLYNVSVREAAVSEAETASSPSPASSWTPSLVYQKSSSIRDCCWYPLMNSEDTRTCCFASTSRDAPIHLHNARDGSLRASYVPLDPFIDELDPAYSLCFSLDGFRLISGFKSRLRVFDLSRPGKETPLSTVLTHDRHYNREGLRGVISSISMNPNGSGLFAVGSFDAHRDYNVGLFVEQHEHGQVAALNCGKKNGGVSSMLWSNDVYLFVGTRNGQIQAFDTRLPDRPLFKCDRALSTQQRVRFALSANHKRLYAACQSRGLVIFDIADNLGSVLGECPMPHENESLVDLALLSDSSEQRVGKDAMKHEQHLIAVSGQRKNSLCSHAYLLSVWRQTEITLSSSILK